MDESITPSELKKPDFLVSTRRYSVEIGGPDGRLGDSEEYFWETPEEKDAMRHVEQMQEEKIWNPGPTITHGNLTSGNDYKGPLYAPHPDLAND